MVICGLKLTHDGAIALIEDGKLIFSIESEKLNNNARHSNLDMSLDGIVAITSEYGYDYSKIDKIVIDGWSMSPNEPINKEEDVFVESIISGKKVKIELAKYGHLIKEEYLLEPCSFKNNSYNFSYNSYLHIAGHALGAYCSSPFAKRGEDSYILVWDGGMPPQLFYYTHKYNKVTNFGTLFNYYGHIYIHFPAQFSPFDEYSKGDMSIPGKAMAYLGLGTFNKPLFEKFEQVHRGHQKMVLEMKPEPQVDVVLTHALIKEIKEYVIKNAIKSEDVLFTFQKFMELLLINGLQQKVMNHPNTVNLCFSGGNALNIKWNSIIRNSGIFVDVWVPPFCNDSGSAIGTACCEMLNSSKYRALEWNVYSGPAIGKCSNNVWSSKPFRIKELAALIYEKKEPILMLNGNAELGPRALGNRSILCPAEDIKSKNLLNELKLREAYRPVSPICLEQDAPEIFTPGTPDPYMLFDHKVKDAWLNKVPAICHVDNTARLQTVNKYQNHLIFELLTEYKLLSGIPLLCNTSANFIGKGFFCDIDSAIEWGKVNYILSNGLLYSKS